MYPDLKAQIASAKTIAVKEGYCPRLLEVLRNIRRGYATTTIYLQLKSAFRARLIKDDCHIFDRQQVWHPTADKITAFGRANLPHSPVLYCSDGPNTAIKEVGAKAGDRIAVVEMGLADPAIHPHIFSLGELRARKKTRKGAIGPELDTMLEKMHAVGINMQRAMMIDGFYADVFKTTGDRFYPMTAAIAQAYMSPSEIDGISYPTVATPLGQNLALKPASALKLLAVRQVKITRLIKPLTDTFFARDEMVSRCLHPDGRIDWYQ